jgi:hypothetical protein
MGSLYLDVSFAIYYQSFCPRKPEGPEIAKHA